MHSRVAKQVSTLQINILLRAAHKLYAVSLQHGDEEEQQLASALLDEIKRITPKFEFSQSIPENSPSYRGLYKAYQAATTPEKKRELRNRMRKEYHDAQRKLP